MLQEIQVSPQSRYSTRKGNPMDKAQHRRILERDNYECQTIIDGEKCLRFAETVHHIQHKKMGGRHGKALEFSESDENKEAQCWRCLYRHHFAQELKG